MLLIADSGSTKTDWRLVSEGSTVSAVQTNGLNPYFLSGKKITTIIKEKVLPVTGHVDKVFFYGAGCALPSKAQQVKDAIEAVIPARLPAEVSGDILGAARGLFQDQAGVTCIIGTGANSCVYDGNKIVRNVPSLGYVFTDWGSGTVLGKDLLSLLLQGKLSAGITKDFQETFRLSKGEILDNIYNEPMANRFLASFTPFLLKHAGDAQCRDIILKNFKNFFTYYVLSYRPEHGDLKVSITGSIAYYFREYVMQVASEMGIAIERIMQHPMEGLIQYHSTTVPATGG